MDNSSANFEPAPDAGTSPFHSGAAPPQVDTTEPPLRGVGDSMRVADIILLTVVVAVLTAIAVRGVNMDAPTDPGTVGLRAVAVAIGALVGLFGTVLVERSVFASLYGAAVGAGLAAALPALLWDPDATQSVMISGGVLLVTGAVLGALRRHGELAALDDDVVDGF